MEIIILRLNATSRFSPTHRKGTKALPVNPVQQHVPPCTSTTNIDQKMASTTGSQQFRDQTERVSWRVNSSEDAVPAAAPAERPLRAAAGTRCCASPCPMACSTALPSCASLARVISRDLRQGLRPRQQRGRTFQLNWPALEDVPDILAELADRADARDPDFSGNCIRNTTTDQFAGVAVDELRGPTRALTAKSSGNGPPCILSSPSCRASSKSRSVAAEDTDRAAIHHHDIGLELVHDDQRASWASAFIVGGGLGTDTGHRRRLFVTSWLGPDAPDYLPRSYPARLQPVTAAVTTSTRHVSRSWSRRMGVRRRLRRGCGRRSGPRMKDGPSTPYSRRKSPAPGQRVFHRSRTMQQLPDVRRRFGLTSTPAARTIREFDQLGRAHIRWIRTGCPGYRHRHTCRMKATGYAPGDDVTDLADGVARRPGR